MRVQFRGSPFRAEGGPKITVSIENTLNNLTTKLKRSLEKSRSGKAHNLKNKAIDKSI